MTNKYNREFLLEYVESENKKNECNVSLDNMEKIVGLIEYFGIELLYSTYYKIATFKLGRDYRTY